MNTTDVRQSWADVKELLKPTWWCGALPGVIMAVLYHAHFHEQQPITSVSEKNSYANVVAPASQLIIVAAKLDLDSKWRSNW